MLRFYQAFSVCTDPKVRRLIHVHTAYTSALKLFRQLVFYLFATGFINHIKTVIRSYVIVTLPENNRIYNAALHSDSAIYVLKR